MHAAIKTRYPAIRHPIEPKGDNPNHVASGWKATPNAFSTFFEDRISRHHGLSHKDPDAPRLGRAILSHAIVDASYRGRRVARSKIGGGGD